MRRDVAGRLLDRANQALQTLERYKAKLDDALGGDVERRLGIALVARDAAVEEDRPDKELAVAILWRNRRRTRELSGTRGQVCDCEALLPSLRFSL